MSPSIFENRIERYESENTLVEADPYGDNAGDLKHVCLYVRYGESPYVDVETRGTFERSGMPGTVFHGVAAYYRLAYLPNATTLHDEVEALILPILQQINANTEIFWRDTNECGRDIDSELAADLDEQLHAAFYSLTEITIEE